MTPTRANHPKQFLAMQGDRRMIPQTVDVLSELSATVLIAVLNERGRFLMTELPQEVHTLGECVSELARGLLDHLARYERAN